MKKNTILYVADEAIVRNKITTFLKNKSFEVIVGKNGKEGLEFFKTHSPELIITDINMPKLNGIEMIKEIKKINPHVNYIFTTTYVELSYLKESMQDKMLRYMVKPINFEELSMVTDEILNPQKTSLIKCVLDASCNILELIDTNHSITDEPQSLINKPFQNILLPDDIKRCNTLFNKFKSEGFLSCEKLTILNINHEYKEFMIDAKIDKDENYELYLSSLEHTLYSFAKFKQMLEKEKGQRSLAEYKNTIHILMMQSPTTHDFLDVVCRNIVKQRGHTIALIYQMSNNKMDEYLLSSYYSSVEMDIDKLYTKFEPVFHNRFTEDFISNKTIYLKNKEVENNPFFKQPLTRKGIKSIITIPIYLNEYDMPKGAFVLLNEKNITISDEDLSNVNDIGLTIALGIDRIEDKQKLLKLLDKATLESRIDPLTNIYNRLMFIEMLGRSIYQSTRFNAPLCIIYFDLDDFKHINDTYGHSEGDKLLKNITKIVNKMIRHSDIFARVGGEEFNILLPSTPLEEGVKVAQKILNTIENTNLHELETITVSAGVALYDEKVDKSGIDFINRADKKLYEAKEAGKNRVCY